MTQTKPNEYILALDIGTSSVRAGLYDMTGRVLPETMVKNERVLDVTRDGGAEIDADAAFDQVLAAIDDVLKKCDAAKGSISHIAASSFWHSLVGVDASGRPTTKVLGWADTRSSGSVTYFRRALNERRTHNRTGARFHSSFWPAKLLWIKETQRKVFDRTACWLSFSDYVMLKLCGHAVTSVSMASATGLFDQRRCRWDARLLKLIGIEKGELPQIQKKDDDAFALSGKFLKRWPRLADARCFPAIGDGAANNIGAGCVSNDEAALMIGTSGAMRVAFAGRPPEKMPRGLWCYRVDRDRVIIGGALSDGGGLYRWLKDLITINDDSEEAELEVRSRIPAGHGITFMPFVAGERSTGYHESASGSIIGLRMHHDGVDILQAALESVAYRFAAIFDQLCGVVPLRTIVASGGALRSSPIWTSIISHVIGCDMVLPDTREASSRGAVLYCLEKLGRLDSLEKIPTPPGARFRFDEKLHALYAGPRREHDHLYRLLTAKK